MPSDLDTLAEELKNKTGLDLVDVLRGTHAETATLVASLVGETLEIALKSKLLADGKPVNNRVFKGSGALATLQKRIDAAHDLNLIDERTRDDAHLVRRIRNKFAHAKEKLHFDSGKVATLAKQFSTYEAAASNQEAFLKAAGGVTERAKTAIQAFRISATAQAEC